MWHWPSQRLDHRTVRFHAGADSRDIGDTRNSRLLCWAEVLALWTDSPDFADAFCSVLAKASRDGPIRWETPRLRRQDLDTPFEFVVVDSPELAAQPDPEPFAEHFRRAAFAHRPRRGGTPSGPLVVCFPNLGGDAELIAPCPVADEDVYVHLARFVQKAHRAQQRALWHEVGLAMERRVDDRPVWLNTAGGGVAWLHVRLDDSPKYYAHRPYC